MSNVVNRLSPQLLFTLFALILLASIGVFTYYQESTYLLIPLILLGGFIFAVDTKKIFLLSFFLLPFSVELHFANGLGTDLPSEPFMLVFTGIAILFFARHFQQISTRIVRHPITLCLLLHVIWTGYAALLSEMPVVSIKFLLAKIWYIVPFYFLVLFWLRDKRDYSILFKLLALALTACALYVMVRHAASGFSFDAINPAVKPMFRNHVNYACLLALFVPFLILLLKWSKAPKVFYLIVPFFLVAIFFSYTRAAILAVALAGISYIVIRMRILHLVIVISIFVSLISTTIYMHNNKFLDLAPNYERTIAHHDFNNLIEATYKMEDISTMERLHRWVAASQMIQTHPIVGFGPGTFYFFYQSYDVSSFRTYVSDNPEKSGIHNYYLMILVEQGIIGLLLFVLMLVVTLIYGQNLYHKLDRGYKKDLVMATLCSYIIILAILLINDMVETDKVGSFFFFCMASLVTCSFTSSSEEGID